MKFKLGRNRPKVRAPTLSLKNYLLATLPTPPAAVDYSAKAAKALADIYGNDENGDCVVAAGYHTASVLIGNANAPVSPDLNAAMCVELYYQLTDGQDSGMDEVTFLNYWHDQGLGPDGAHKIVGYVAIDATDETEVMTAIWLFENLMMTLELPDAFVDAMDTMQDGFTWNLSGPPNPDNGHAICGFGYNNKGINPISTWGMTGSMPFSALGYYCNPAQGGQLFSVLSQEAIDVATGKAPSGFAASQLLADLQMFS